MSLQDQIAADAASLLADASGFGLVLGFAPAGDPHGLRRFRGTWIEQDPSEDLGETTTTTQRNALVTARRADLPTDLDAVEAWYGPTLSNDEPWTLESAVPCAYSGLVTLRLSHRARTKSSARPSLLR